MAFVENSHWHLPGRTVREGATAAICPNWTLASRNRETTIANRVLRLPGTHCPGLTTRRQNTIPIWVVVVATIYGIGCQLSRGDPNRTSGKIIERSIAFDDLAPPGLMLKQCWNAMGMDSKERVYIGFTSKRLDGRQDFAVFRYDPSTGERRFLGTFMDVSQAAGNLRPAEKIPKGHTRMLQIDGKMYMGSQGFHDLKAAIDTLSSYRGSHLYAYDLASGALEDVSRSLANGVVTEHQGIIALSHMPGSDFLVGLVHPSSDIVLFDHKHGRVQQIVPGIPWRLGNPLSREVVVTKKNKIYTYRGTEDPAQRDEVHRIWAHDLKTNESTETAYTATGGFWNRQTWTRDGNTIYLATVNGELYKLDVGTEAFAHLGYFLPREEYAAGERIDYLFGITLSVDEKRIYGIPRRSRSGSSNLYAYEINRGTVRLVGQLEPGVYTGSHMLDSRGNIYFAKFDGEAWEGQARLAILRP